MNRITTLTSLLLVSTACGGRTIIDSQAEEDAVDGAPDGADELDGTVLDASQDGGSSVPQCQTNVDVDGGLYAGRTVRFVEPKRIQTGQFSNRPPSRTWNGTSPIMQLIPSDFAVNHAPRSAPESTSKKYKIRDCESAGALIATPY
ncbi:MAG: hypothetical protein ABTD50_24670 [Polyangiaceae bacterium]|jgi:hypothetical protein